MVSMIGMCTIIYNNRSSWCCTRRESQCGCSRERRKRSFHKWHNNYLIYFVKSTYKKTKKLIRKRVLCLVIPELRDAQIGMSNIWNPGELLLASKFSMRIKCFYKLPGSPGRVRPCYRNGLTSPRMTEGVLEWWTLVFTFPKFSYTTPILLEGSFPSLVFHYEPLHRFPPRNAPGTPRRLSHERASLGTLR